MRATLLTLGAFLFLAYPLVLLMAIVRNVDPSQKKPQAAAIVFTPRSSSQLLDGDTGQRSRGVLRSTTIRKFGN